MQDPFSLIFDPLQEDDASIQKILLLIGYTKLDITAFSAFEYPAGYQTIHLKDRLFIGQRNCFERLNKTGIDFKGLSVLDIGCNIGGMLHAIAGDIKYGIGLDIDPKCINAANAIKRYNDTTNLDFFVVDLDKDEPAVVLCLMPLEKVDICFLLSVCLWIKNWREVISMCHEISDRMLFEANGSQEVQDEQMSFIRSKYKDVVLLSDNSSDDNIWRDRQLYICSK